MVADQVAHLNARDTTLVFVSRAMQGDIERVKACYCWCGTAPHRWYTQTGWPHGNPDSG